jgi:hypothetical protein
MQTRLLRFIKDVDWGLVPDKSISVYAPHTYQWIFQTGQSTVPQSQLPPLSLMSW